MNGERATRIAVGPVALEVHARQVVDDVVDRLTRLLASDELLGEDVPRLGRIGDLDAADVLGAIAGNDNRFIFECRGTRRLGINGRRQHCRRAKQHELFHGKLLPRVTSTFWWTAQPLKAV